MNSQFTLCAFCGSSPGHDPTFIRSAMALGRGIAEQGWRLLYGAGGLGLMGALAGSALQNGAHVTGIIPTFLKNKEHMQDNLVELLEVETLHERQYMMMERADAFLILPGGAGTLAEFFEVVTWRQLGLHNKPILVLNADGYWNSLVSVIDDMQAYGFLHDLRSDLFTVCDSVEGLVKEISNIKGAS